MSLRRPLRRHVPDERLDFRLAAAMAVGLDALMRATLDRRRLPDSCAMRVHLGSDHAGLELKDHLVGWLREQGHEPVDHGPFVYDAQDDYPVFCLRAAEAVVGRRRAASAS